MSRGIVSAVMVVRVLQGLVRKAFRAYYFQCAREDLQKWRVVIPSGVWLCEQCTHVAFDLGRLRAHVKLAHA